MTITFVAETLDTTAIGSATDDIALAVSLTDDVWVFVWVCDSATTNAGTGTAAAAAGWTIIGATQSAAPDYVIGYKRMGATPDTTIPIEESTHSTGGLGCFVAQLYRGVDETTVLDQTTVLTTGAGSAPNSLSITTQTDGALVITVFGLDDDAATAVTAPTGYTTSASWNTAGSGTGNACTAGMGHKVIATAAAEDPGAWSTNGNDDWVAWTLALVPAAAGGSIIPQIMHNRRMQQG